MNKTNILIVVDKPDKIENIVDILKRDNYSVSVTNKNNVVKTFPIEKPQLVLSYIKDVDICHKIRKNTINDDVLIAFVNKKTDLGFEILAYENGADDCFGFYDTYSRLSSKIKALLRRKTNNIVIEDNIKANGVELRLEDNSVFVDDKHIILPKIEFKILKLLVTKQNIIVNKDIIKKEVWGSPVVSNNTIAVHIKQIKYKIGDDKISCHDTLGYRFISK